MLNKEICKKCIDNRSVKHLEDWDSWCEKIWEKHGEVWCYWVELIKITEDPPEKCEYRLEHLVINNAK